MLNVFISSSKESQLWCLTLKMYMYANDACHISLDGICDLFLFHSNCAIRCELKTNGGMEVREKFRPLERVLTSGFKL